VVGTGITMVTVVRHAEARRWKRTRWSPLMVTVYRRYGVCPARPRAPHHGDLGPQRW